VILVRPDIDTADVAGFAAASGALTAIGGRTAHASLIARQMGEALRRELCRIGGGRRRVAGQNRRHPHCRGRLALHRRSTLATIETWRAGTSHKGETALALAE